MNKKIKNLNFNTNLINKYKKSIQIPEKAMINYELKEGIIYEFKPIIYDLNKIHYGKIIKFLINNNGKDIISIPNDSKVKLKKYGLRLILNIDFGFTNKEINTIFKILDIYIENEKFETVHIKYYALIYNLYNKLKTYGNGTIINKLKLYGNGTRNKQENIINFLQIFQPRYKWENEKYIFNELNDLTLFFILYDLKPGEDLYYKTLNSIKNHNKRIYITDFINDIKYKFKTGKLKYFFKNINNLSKIENFQII